MKVVKTVPIFIQATSVPLAVGNGDGTLDCECGHTLIAGYQSRQYIGVGFKCFQCARVTLSEKWPKGEPLPRNLLVYSPGGYFLSQSVDVSSRGGMASEKEVERIKKATTIRADKKRPLDLDMKGLDALEARYNKLSSGEMIKASQRARQAAASKNSLFLKSNLAWAIDYVRSCHAGGALDLDDDKTQAALTFLTVANHLLGRWEHHPLFELISKSVVLEYPHTVTQLLAASYLAEMGNTVGFNDHAKFEGQSPDLFINANAVEAISIEVKAPSELQWPSPCPTVAALEDMLIKQIYKASKQIIGEWGGVVVIGTSWASHDGHATLVQALKSLDTRKQISSRVAGVIGVSINILGHYLTPSGGIGSDVVSEVHVQLNSRFAGEQFMSVNKRNMRRG